MNAILNHCRLPTVSFVSNKRSLETEECIEISDNEIEDFFIDKSSAEDLKESSEALVRPGIVHRLDKGTSGLLVIAKVKCTLIFKHSILTSVFLVILWDLIFSTISYLYFAHLL